MGGMLFLDENPYSVTGQKSRNSNALSLALKFFLILFLSIIGTLVQPQSMLRSFKHFQLSATFADTNSHRLK